MGCPVPKARASNANETVAAIDANGFLSDRSLWTIDLARHISHTRGVSVHTKIQWLVLSELRHYYNRFAAVPSLPRLYRNLRLPRNTSPLLFGLYLDAWRIAGLPSPGEEAKSYMAGMRL